MAVLTKGKEGKGPTEEGKEPSTRSAASAFEGGADAAAEVGRIAARIAQLQAEEDAKRTVLDFAGVTLRFITPRPLGSPVAELDSSRESSSRPAGGDRGSLVPSKEEGRKGNPDAGADEVGWPLSVRLLIALTFLLTVPLLGLLASDPMQGGRIG